MGTWEIIDIEFHGPYKISNHKDGNDGENKNETGEFIVVTIFDSFSKWIMIEPILLCPSPDLNGLDTNSVAKTASSYIITVLCHFGLAHFRLDYKSLHGESLSNFPNIFEEILANRLESLRRIMKLDFVQPNDCNLRKSYPSTTNFKNEEKENLFNVLNLNANSHSTRSNGSKFVENLIDQMIKKYEELAISEDYSKLELQTILNIFQFKHRIGSFCYDAHSNASSKNNAFFSMFGKRSPFTEEIDCEGQNRHRKIGHHASSNLPLVSPIYERRNIKSSRLECRHCGDIFTSRVSFKIHQKYHLDRAKERGIVEGQKLSNQPSTNDIQDVGDLDDDCDVSEVQSMEDHSLQDDADYSKTKKSILVKQTKPNNEHSKTKSTDSENHTKNISNTFNEAIGQNLLYNDVEDLTQTRPNENRNDTITNEETNNEDAKTDHHHSNTNVQTNDACFSLDATVKESAIQNVKALLVATKGDRRKRGKYIKFDQNLRNEIASYAEKQGASKTAKVYSEKLAFDVSESSVRNFMKASSKILKQLNKCKNEIGQSFHDFEAEGSNNKDQNSLQSIEGDGGIHLAPTKDDSEDNIDDDTMDKSYRFSQASQKSIDSEIVTSRRLHHNTTSRFTCDEYLKLEIGKFAFYHGNQSAISHYSSKLQHQMKESTVRKFKRLWMKKKRIPSQNIEPRSLKSSFTNRIQLGGTDFQPNDQPLKRELSSIMSDSPNNMTRLLKSENQSNQDELYSNIKSSRGRQLDLSTRSRLLFPLEPSGISIESKENATTSRVSLTTETKPHLPAFPNLIEENIPVSLIINNREGMYQ